MAFPKFHGISLAANAFIENARVERLAADPTPLAAGRIWFNTTEKALKYTSLDETDAVIVHTFGSTSYIDNSINEAISGLGAAFSYAGEIAPGADVPSALDLSTLTNQDTGAYYKATASGYVTLPGVREDVFVNATDGVLFNSTGSFDVVDNSNSQVQGTTDFVTVTGSTDTGFVVDIAEGFKLRVVELETKVALLETNVGELLTGLNGQRATFKSGAAALSHTVAHNLNSEFVQVTTWVEGDDLVYRNDIVAVEETDLNNLTVSLTEAANVKVVVQAMDDLAITTP